SASPCLFLPRDSDVKPHPRHLRSGLLALVFAVTLGTGCGGGIRLQGEVTLDGSAVDGGSITFFTEAERERKNISAEIKDGKSAVDAAGFPAGAYRVEIYWHKKTGKQVPSNDPPNKIDETIQVIPEKYNVDSKETVEVKSGTNTLNFALKAK